MRLLPQPQRSLVVFRRGIRKFASRKRLLPQPQMLSKARLLPQPQVASESNEIQIVVATVVHDPDLAAFFVSSTAEQVS